jgi:hypothetical protein
MSSLKQILPTFLIPFLLAVGLFVLGDYFFSPECNTKTEEICFGISDPPSTLAEILYRFLVVGLFLASLILPPFLTMREYQASSRNKSESPSIFE